VLGDQLEIGGTAPWPVSGPDAGIVSALGGRLRATSFPLESHDWLDLMIAPFLVPPAARTVHAYHTSGRASRPAASR
jgi:hypothetical protein